MAAAGSRPTIRDVARVAKTSIKTVSRVLNREGTVSEALARRVEDAIEQLGYRRDEAARLLRSESARSDMIGLVVLNLGDPFFAALAEGVESVAAERGTLLVTGSSDGSPGRQDEIVQMLISRRIDGILVVPVGGDLDLLESEMGRGTPMVFVDMEPERAIGDVVLSDHEGAAVAAAEHLLAAGHRRIGFLGLGDPLQSIRRRRAGYDRALADAGIDVDAALIVEGDVFDPDDAARAVERLLDLPQPPTALYSAYWTATVGALRALRSRGLQDEIALVSADDIEAGDLISPGLTATPQDPFELGRSAAGLLFQRLEGHDGPPETITMPVSLIERGSGEIRPATRTREA